MGSSIWRGPVGAGEPAEATVGVARALARALRLGLLDVLPAGLRARFALALLFPAGFFAFGLALPADLFLALVFFLAIA